MLAFHQFHFNRCAHSHVPNQQDEFLKTLATDLRLKSEVTAAFDFEVVEERCPKAKMTLSGLVAKIIGKVRRGICRARKTSTAKKQQHQSQQQQQKDYTPSIEIKKSAVLLENAEGHGNTEDYEQSFNQGNADIDHETQDQIDPIDYTAIAEFAQELGSFELNIFETKDFYLEGEEDNDGLIEALVGSCVVMETLPPKPEPQSFFTTFDFTNYDLMFDVAHLQRIQRRSRKTLRNASCKADACASKSIDNCAVKISTHLLMPGIAEEIKARRSEGRICQTQKPRCKNDGANRAFYRLHSHR